MAQLTILNSPLSRTQVPLAPTGTLIGRSPDCDLALAHDWVSRRHCRVFRDGERWLIEDLDSCNGICVNGRPVDGRTQLSPSDLIAIGPLVFQFSDDPPTDSAARPAGTGTSPQLPLGDQAAAAPPGTGGSLEAEPHAIRIALPPDLRFTVRLAAALLSQQQITRNGKTPLNTLARRGHLAADTAFGGDFAGHFRGVRFLTLDGYDVAGRAGYALRVGLLLPRKGKQQQRKWLEAYLLYKVEHPVFIPRASGPGVLDQAAPEAQLGPATHTLLDSGVADDPGATSLLVSWGKSRSRELPYDVTREELVAWLEELARSCVVPEGSAAGGLQAVLKERCIAAAGLYRAWYRDRWGAQAQRHDSQLPIGELSYEFDAQGKQTGRPIAVALTSVYRWV